MDIDWGHLGGLIANATVSTVRVETNFLPPITIDIAQALEGPPGLMALLQPRVVLTGPALGDQSVELAPYGTPTFSGVGGVAIGVIGFAVLLGAVFMLGRASA